MCVPTFNFCLLVEARSGRTTSRSPYKAFRSTRPSAFVRPDPPFPLSSHGAPSVISHQVCELHRGYQCIYLDRANCILGCGVKEAGGRGGGNPARTGKEKITPRRTITQDTGRPTKRHTRRDSMADRPPQKSGGMYIYSNTNHCHFRRPEHRRTDGRRTLTLKKQNV